MNNQPALYLHIPFCLKKCPYCAFYKVKWDKDDSDDFIDALCREIAWYRDTCHVQPRTVFMGGGTPSLLRPGQLEKIFAVIGPLASNTEVTIEMNPSSVSKTTFSQYKDLGINRISLGVQSLNNDELEFLGRQHDAALIHHTLDTLRSFTGFSLNCDVISGVPGATLASLKNTFTQLMPYLPDHISAYDLTIEPNTPFFKQNIAPNHDEAAEQMTFTETYLKERGYTQYEVCNYAKPGKECQHNIVYWKSEDYIGLGPGAHSFFNRRRYKHAKDLKAYLENPLPSIPKKPMSKKQQLQEFMIMGLRLAEGVVIGEVERRFGEGVVGLCGRIEGLVVTETHIKTTERGRYFLNEVCEGFL